MAQHQHKKRFGQNFLNNQSVIDHIVSAIRPSTQQHLIEIGPGEAALTAPLLEVVKKLDIIEIDSDLIGPLTEKFGHSSAFHLHHTDALTFDYATLIENNHKVRIVGNLPYNISSPLLFHLLNYSTHIEDMHFMLQKEVVDRITAESGSKTFGRLSVMMQYHCQTENLFTVGPEHFTPPPKVDSAIVRLIPYQTKPYQANNETLFADLVKQCFSQKRKTLRNNLKGWLTAEQIEACEIDPGIRAEAMSIEEFVRLSNFYGEQ